MSGTRSFGARARSVLADSPLGALARCNNYLERRLAAVPIIRAPFVWLGRLFDALRRHVDGAFDRRWGTDTGGRIHAGALGAVVGDRAAASGYVAIPPQEFLATVGQLGIKCSDFEFVDYGSGKGRALLLAAECGFAKATGVEFAPDLHEAAVRNVAIYEKTTGKPSRICPVCMDATAFDIPDVPVVLYLFNPFGGTVMERVLGRIIASHARNPRPMLSRNAK